MRIVGGRHRGRRLESLAGAAVRPTSDRARQAVFDVLAHSIDGFAFAGAKILDAFAGTGALGLEALSRGAAFATFLETDRAAAGLIRRNAAGLGEARAIMVLSVDAADPPRPPLAARMPATLVFLDPPYGSGLAASAMANLALKGWIGDGAVCVVERKVGEPFQAPPGFALLDERTYGAAKVVFVRRFHHQDTKTIDSNIRARTV